VDGIGERIHKRGWRQGIIVPASYLLEGLPDGSPTTENDFAMVVSQSCDLLHHDLVNEPSAMILLLRSADAGNPEVMHGRNPRNLHFPTLNGRWLEAWAWNQTAISREVLAKKDVSVEISLSPKVLRLVLEWLAKRFTRIAFPDGFNGALRPKSKALGKLLKKNHHLFSEILMAVSPFDELDEGSHYQVACYLLMETAVHEDVKHLADARLIAAKLEELFEDCGMEVVECSPASEGLLSVAEFNNLLSWDYDHLTNRDLLES
jgi:hypothetical protein